MIDQLTIRFRDEDDGPKQMRLQELMPLAMNVTSLCKAVEAAELFQFALNYSLLEVEAEVKKWMSFEHPVTPTTASTKGYRRSHVMGDDHFLLVMTTFLRLFATMPAMHPVLCG